MRSIMQIQQQPSTIISLLATTEKIGSIMCRVLQRFLVFFIFVLFVTFSYCFLSYLFAQRPHMQPLSMIKKIAYLSTGIVLLYNLIYNYTMANRVGPGYRQNLPNQVMALYKIQKRCKKCTLSKPIRTHHCSICDKCIMQMDHHCPWMGVCIGHHNRRYFIRFLLYLILACMLVVVLVINLQLPRAQVFLFMVTISIIIGLFGLFHWIIALCGRTTLQLCDIMDNYHPSRSISTNFQIIFGTKNIFLALMPIYIPLTFQGCEWNQMKINNTIEIEPEQGILTA